jgi:hypothetical protein
LVPDKRQQGVVKMKRTPLRKVSKKRAKELRKYYWERGNFLAMRRFCEMPKVGICLNPATDVHHEKGRRGKTLLDKRYWWAMCREHHRWIHDHAREARKLGLLK